jgi:hypothetical protein
MGIDLFKSVLMYSNGAICLIKLFFKMGLFTVFSWVCLCMFGWVWPGLFRLGRVWRSLSMFGWI